MTRFDSSTGEPARVGSSSSTVQILADVELESIPRSPTATATNVAPSQHEAANPTSLLSEHEIAVLKRQSETPELTHGVGSLYAFATVNDLLIIFVSLICSAATGAALPCMTIIFGGLQGVFQEYLLSDSMTKSDFNREMVTYVLYFIYLAIGTFFASYISTVGFIYTGEHIANAIRKAYLKSCLHQNIAYFDKLGAGEVTSHITSDALAVQQGISEKVGLLVQSVFTFLAGFLIGFIKSWRLTLILSSALVALLAVTLLSAQFLGIYAGAGLNTASEAPTLAEETFSSIRVTVAFGIQDRLVKQFDAHLSKSQIWGIKTKITIAFMLGSIMSLTYLTYGLGFWQGSTFLARGELNLENLITCMMAVLIGSFQMGTIGPSFHAFTSAVGAASEMLNTINRTPPLDSSSEEGQKPEKVDGSIRLEHVRHIYPSRPEVVVMDNVSLDVPSGKVTAIVGASGSGKSTIVGLIERFYEPVHGTIYLDGHDISTLNLRWLRQQISLVGQEPALFATTIFENIKFGMIGTIYEDVSESDQRERIIEAAKQANAHDFISRLPDGYMTHVGDRGFLLSGGEKQRIAIARAIISNPKILLLDEATSALDTKSEGIVQLALRNASEGRTTITIAHNLSTIMHAHNIVVMSHGKIVEQGSHSELVSQGGAYFDLVQAQKMNEGKLGGTTDTSADLIDEEDEQLVEKMSRVRNISTYITDPADIADDGPSRQNRVSIIGGQSLSSIAIRTNGTVVDEEPNYTIRSLVTFVAAFNRKEWHFMLAGVLFSILCGGANPAQSVFFAKQVNVLAEIIRPDRDPWDTQRDSNFWSLMYLMLGLVQFLTHLGQGWTLGICSEWLSRRVRLQTFASILRQDMSYFDQDQNNVGALTAFLCVETAHAAGLSGTTLGTLLVSVTNVVAGIVLSLAIGWKLALVCSCAVPIVIACGYFRVRMLDEFGKRSAGVYAQTAAFAAENVSQMRTVASLTRERQACTQYNQALDTQQAKSLRSIAQSSLLFAASQSVLYLCFALGFWYGSTLIADLEYDMFQFFVCFMAIIFGAQSAGTFFTFAPDLTNARHSATILKRLSQRKPAIDTWSTEGAAVEEVEGTIEFKNVHFRYPTRPQRPVLRGMSFRVEPGQYVALVGASGCGKSTTIALLERFYDPLLGQVLVDGQDISQLNVNNYRSHIALVNQEPTLYQGTIRENIRMGSLDDDLSDAAIEVACREAHIFDFISSLPDGMETVVGAKGSLLSGGQKQRIAIARALVRNPKVLLLDEATSALDSESEQVVQAALDRAAKGRTTIAIAHRLSTIQRADLILVCDNGVIVESGTHHELMVRGGKYAEMVKLQDLRSSNA